MAKQYFLFFQSAKSPHVSKDCFENECVSAQHEIFLQNFGSQKTSVNLKILFLNLVKMQC